MCSRYPPVLNQPSLLYYCTMVKTKEGGKKRKGGKKTLGPIAQARKLARTNLKHHTKQVAILKRDLGLKKRKLKEK